MSYVTLDDLSKALADEMGWSKGFSKQFSKDIFVWIKQQLGNGFIVKIKNFGSFSMPYRKERRVLHPKTKAIIQIAGKQKPLFRASKLVLSKINKKRDEI
jgi:nucleoid DNA-binding protein